MSSRKAKRNASPPPSPSFAAAPAAQPVSDAAQWGERLRRIALGLTVALAMVRLFWTSDATSRGFSAIDGDFVAEIQMAATQWSFLVLITALIGIGAMAIGGATRLRIAATDIAFLVVSILVGMSAVTASDHRPALNLAWDWLGWGLIYAMVRCLPRSRAESSAIARTLFACAIAVSTYGLFQGFVELPETQKAYMRDRATYLAEAGIDPRNENAVKQFEDRVLGSSEIFATYALANSLAGFLVGPAALAAALIFSRRASSKNFSWWELLPVVVPIAILYLCLLFTKSRSSYLALLAAMMIPAWRYRGLINRRAALTVLGLVGAVIALGVALGAVLGKLDWLVLAESTKSLRYRLEYWQGAWGVITESASAFWLGHGPGNFGAPYLRHKLETSSEMIADPHNLILDVWATAGAVAALGLVIALASAFRAAFGPSRSEPQGDDADRRFPPPSSSGGWIVVCGGASLLLIPFFDPSFIIGRWMWLMLGFAGSLGLAHNLFRDGVSSLACGSAAVAVAINLLAAGGISYAAVALPLWIWVGLALNLRDDRPEGKLRIFGRAPACVAALFWSAIAGLFYGAIVPFWRSEARIDDALALVAPNNPQPDFDQAEAACLKAVELDNFSPRPFLVLTAIEYRKWLSLGRPSDRNAWIKPLSALEKALDEPRSPFALAIHQQRVQLAKEILRQLDDVKPGDREYLQGQTIIQSTRRSTQLHPSDARLHADLARESAEFFGAMGAPFLMRDAANEAREALRLDEETPHPDKKLPDDVRAYLKRKLPEWESSADKQ